MIVNKFYLLFSRRYRGPDDADGTGAAVDRGDDFEPTDEEADAEAARQAAADAAAAKAAKTAKDAKQVAAVAKAGLKGIAAGEDDDDDEEVDPEETDEEREAREAAAAAKGKRIPLKRHEAILAKERARRQEVEKQLQGFQGQRQVVATNEAIGALETRQAALQADYDKAITDGETAKASAAMVAIRKLDREIMAKENDVKIAAAEARATENARYNITLERIEAEYPELNEDSDEFDEDQFKEVVDLMNAYRAHGKTPTEALQKAVKVLIGASSASQKAATSVKPKVTEEDAAAKLRTERKVAAADKTAKALKQPSTATAKTGLNSNDAGAARTAKDVIKMKQEEFAKLDEKELARLRGDEVEAE